MANPPRAATIRGTVTQVEASPGPAVEQFCIPLDYPALFKWVVGDTSTVDHTSVLGHTGGTIGRWKIVAQNPPWLGETIITPGTSKAAEINSAITAAYTRFVTYGIKQTVRLVAGLYTLESAIVAKSGVTLTGAAASSTVLRATFAAAPTTNTNAMILAQGALNTKLGAGGTTPTNAANGGVNYYPPGSQAVSVVSAGTIAADDWIVYDGHNDPNYSEYYGGPGTLSRYQELLQVDSVSSLTLRLKTHTLQYHTLTNGGSATAITVKGCDPIVGFTLQDVVLDGDGCANGMLCEYAAEFAVSRVAFQNFARFGIEWTTASVGLNMTDCTADSCNGFVSSGLASSHRVTMFNCRTSGTGSRYQAAGRIRGMVYLREHSAEWMMVGCDFSHVALPLHLQSSRNFTAVGCRFRDSDVDELLVRDAAAADDESRSEVGAGIDMGSVSLNYADWSVGTNIIGCVVEDARGGSIAVDQGSVSAVWLHDHRAMTISDLRIVNTGKSPYATIDGVVKPMLGLREQDCEYQADGINIVGCEYAWIRNSGQGDKKRALRIHVIPSSGAIPPNSITLKSDPTGFARVWDLYTNGNVYFGGTFGNSLSDYRTQFDRVQFDDDLYTATFIIIKNITGGTRVTGDVVEIDSSLTDGTVKTTATTPTTGATSVATIAMPQGNTIADSGFSFAAVGSGHRVVRHGTSECRPGLLLRAAGGGTHYADSAATPGDARIGMATSYKAAGSAGLVRAA